MSDTDTLLSELLAGEHHALARVITKIENRAPGYRDLVAALHAHAGHADVIGITGSPGAGKSTLVDEMARRYRDDGLSVGVIAIDPSSPFSGGAVLGDRIRMASTVGDMDVFVRSMAARGSLGGVSPATTDAVRALDAFGKDKILVETVGAGQNEIDIVKTADTVAVLVPPDSGDDVQMLKAGILEIADVFVLNKADLSGADRTITDLREMVMMREDAPSMGHHGADAHSAVSDGAKQESSSDGADGDDWRPPIVETVAETGEGVGEFRDTLGEHSDWLSTSGEYERKRRERYTAEIRRLLREDVRELVQRELDADGGLDDRVAAVAARDTDPYTVADDALGLVRECIETHRED